jgi:hypothetical protein
MYQVINLQDVNEISRQLDLKYITKDVDLKI